ncbi:hypothetical protein [Marinobacter sp. ELB17]|uniref:hypothetical protein n=1 Tax=Marinobacter sp. ELB17 TaxID=270374 RepID=UPI0000F388CA|nr:hypothetical protein [Marinobacter sp. ELB17]EAZ97343.1 hypothetical protein MELB17_09403 [Marinobacter sp. ELB17]
MEIEWKDESRPVTCSHGPYIGWIFIVIFAGVIGSITFGQSRDAIIVTSVAFIFATWSVAWMLHRRWKKMVITRNAMTETFKLLKAGVALDLDLPCLPSDTLSIMTNQMLKNWAITANDILIRADQIHVDATSKIPERYKPGTARK